MIATLAGWPRALASRASCSLAASAFFGNAGVGTAGGQHVGAAFGKGGSGSSVYRRYTMKPPASNRRLGEAGELWQSSRAMDRVTHPLLFVVLLAACDCDDEASSPQPTAQDRATAAEPAAEPEAPVDPPVVPEAEPPDVEVSGLTARRVEGGLIEVRGADRWGGRVDTTYESAEYLRDALPVLARSITEEQAAALRDWVETLEDE